MPVSMQETTETTQATVTLASIRCRYNPSCSSRTKRLNLGALTGVLFPLVHLLFELLGLLLLYEGETSKAFFEFERVKEGPILVVGKGVVNLLIPYHSTICRLPVRISRQPFRDMQNFLPHTEISTILSQNVFPTKSLDSTAAPCNPVYVHRDLSGYATYNRATATAWILFDAFGTVRFTVSLSTSPRTDGILVFLLAKINTDGGKGRSAHSHYAWLAVVRFRLLLRWRSCPDAF